jgi:hypothetical protein
VFSFAKKEKAPIGAFFVLRPFTPELDKVIAERFRADDEWDHLLPTRGVNV